MHESINTSNKKIRRKSIDQKQIIVKIEWHDKTPVHSIRFFVMKGNFF